MHGTHYRTIAQSAEADVVERRSVFRCTLERCETVDTAREVIDRCRSDYRDARHHCSAMIIGAAGALRYRNDDGEPAGTAGDPMLRMLEEAEVSDVVAVVSRWFGGTLLGTGGLMHAYGGAVRAALDAAGRVVRERRTIIEVDSAHADAGRVESVLRGSDGVTVQEVAYAERAVLTLAVVDPDAVLGRVAELTAGAADVRTVGACWVDV